MSDAASIPPHWRRMLAHLKHGGGTTNELAGRDGVTWNEALWVLRMLQRRKLVIRNGPVWTMLDGGR